MTAESTITQVINNAIARANTSAEKAIAYSDQAQTVAVSVLNLGSIPNPTQPSIAIQPFPPNEDLSAAFTLAFDTAVAKFDTGFQLSISDFMNKWFPSFEACLKTTVDPWICDTITAGGVGLPVNVERALWDREREREVIETARLQSESVNAFADRGWSLPSGVLVDERAKIAEAGANRIAQASRDQAIQAAQIRIDMLKFAVEKGVQLRLGVVSALVDFLNAWLKVPALAIEKARNLVDAKARLWDQTSNYYQALIAAAALLLDFDKLRIDSALRAQANFVAAVTASIEGKVGAAVGAAGAMGDLAAAALGSLNSLASINNDTISNTSS